MNWLFPTFFVGAAAAIVPIILHFLRRRATRPQPFPSLRFLGVASQAEQRKHRLRRWLILLLRCAVFALLAMMFARPFFPVSARQSSRTTIIVLDNSFSLQATGRMDQVKSWARAAFGRFKPGETIGVLLMNPQPAWLIAPTRDQAAAWRAFEQFQPGWQATRAEPALRFAASTLDTSPSAEKRILFVGDHQANSWRADDFKRTLPAGISVAFTPIAPDVRTQLALGQLALTRDNNTVTLRLTVRNFSDTVTRTLNVFIGHAEKPAATTTLSFDARENEDISVSFDCAESDRWIRCSLSDDDLAADNTVYALLPRAGNNAGLPVLLDRNASGAADHVATAYEALAELPPFFKVHPLSSKAWAAPAVAVLRNDASFAGENRNRLDAFLSAGGSALIFANGGTAQTQWLNARKATPASVAGPARIRDWNIEHPLVTPLAERGLRSLVGWQFSRAWSLPADAVEPLSFWSDGSIALGELPVGRGRVLIAGFSADRRDGDWSIESAFVPFLHRVATYLAQATERIEEKPPRVGVPIPLPENTGSWQNLSAAKTPSAAETVSASITPSAPGIYAWTSATGAQQLYAVGLDPDESNLAPWPGSQPWLDLVSKEKASSTARAKVRALLAQEAEQQNSLWWWCAAFAALFFLTEMALANRTAR